VTRGDVHRVHLARGRGREQQGTRLAVVLQADELLGLSTVVVAPTSQSARPASFRPRITVAGEDTRVLVEQLRAVDAGRLGERVGHLDVDEQRAVDEATRVILSL
jgi:mRNA interferase MazF